MYIPKNRIVCGAVVALCEGKPVSLSGAQQRTHGHTHTNALKCDVLYAHTHGVFLYAAKRIRQIYADYIKYMPIKVMVIDACDVVYLCI